MTMNSWQPIGTAPELTPVVIGCKGWTPCIAERRDDGAWCEYLGGDFYGTKPPFEPTHWMPLEQLPDSE